MHIAYVVKEYPLRGVERQCPGVALECDRPGII